jgi:hypothetical protein
MSLNQYYPVWLARFKSANLSDEIAQEEFQTWAESLDGELSNDFTQTYFSASDAADEVIQDLQS